MVDPGGEVALGRLEGVVSGEVDVQEENTACVWGVFGSHDCSLPMVLVFLVDWSSRAAVRGVFAEVDKFFLDSFQSHYANLNYKSY